MPDARWGGVASSVWFTRAAGTSAASQHLAGVAQDPSDAPVLGVHNSFCAIRINVTAWFRVPAVERQLREGSYDAGPVQRGIMGRAIPATESLLLFWRFEAEAA